MNLCIQEVLDACKGKWVNNPVSVTSGGTAVTSVNTALDEIIITSISTDTREITPGALFVPIVGERFDGHDFIAQAAERGAVCVISEKPVEALIPLILVSSTRTALMDLAAYYRRLHDIKAVAVVGSAGKTTTKEMIAAVLANRYKTKKTIKNYNNDIGVPLSIFQLEPDDQAIVLEMGMNHANEITPLSKISAPDIAVVTHIGDEHMENFANREGILHANLEIVDGLHPGGTIILNGNDPLLTGHIAQDKIRAFNVRYPSSENILFTEPLGMNGTRCRFTINGQEINLTVPLPGNHMVMNALLACAAGVEMGLTPQEIADGIAAMEPPDGRLSVKQANNMTVIDDTYNANPDSMREAINVLMLKSTPNTPNALNVSNTPSTPNKKTTDPPVRYVCILGDMYELGSISEERHRELGIFAAATGIDLLITVGPMARWIHEGYLATTSRVFSALHFTDIAGFLAQWKTLLFPGDVILVKASNGMSFKNIVKIITEETA